MVRRAEVKGHVVGVRFVEQGENGADESLWTAPWSRWRAEAPIIGSFPKNLELVLGNEIFIAKETLSPQLRNRSMLCSIPTRRKSSMSALASWYTGELVAPMSLCRITHVAW